MKFRSVYLGSAQSLVALSVTLAVIVSAQSFAFAFPRSHEQLAAAPLEFQLQSASATLTARGVLLAWRTNGSSDNLGFNIYRVEGELRTRVNREIIPGAVFSANVPGHARDGYSYSWLDPAGVAAATYYLESVSLQGVIRLHAALTPLTRKDALAPAETAPAEIASASNSFERYFPAGTDQTDSPVGTFADQWAIAGQPALKIGIRRDGWYRVTQAQMLAAGFNPNVDIRNLRLFTDALEVAINTSQSAGPFGAGDYLEFYGRGLDTTSSDTRTYYLLAGTAPGKRVRAQIQLDGEPVVSPDPFPVPTPVVVPASAPSFPSGGVLLPPIFYSPVERAVSVWTDSLPHPRTRVVEPDDVVNSDRHSAARDYVADNLPAPVVPVAVERVPSANPANQAERLATGNQGNSPIGHSAGPAPSPAKVVRATQTTTRKTASVRKRKRSKLRRARKLEHSHAPASPTFEPANFDATSERKDRSVYFVTVLNGDKENFFGQVITFNATTPASQTISTPNPDLGSGGTAHLEIALQGVNSVPHQISVKFNDVVVGSFSFFGFDPASGGHPVQTFDIPVSQLQNGANTIKFVLPGGGDVSIVDYVRLTYPHLFRADAGALRFKLRGSNSVTVDGFAAPSVKLIDYTDPLNVSITRPASEPSASGYAITVPASDPPAKAPRLLYAIAEGQFDQAASLTLNQPSSLNAGANAADFLIIAHQNFSAGLEPLRLARQNQGLAAKLVDVADVYDEFGFGEHGPQAIKSFLAHAATHWVTAPRYVVFAGDASLDPRNYQNAGNFDFVPTKLVDATYNETASDDWLADFDDDGIADIPVGRLPVRNAAEASLVVSKIINFTPVNVPQAALLIADDPGTAFDFETGNDNVAALLPASMTVQRVNVRTEPSNAQATTDIINGINQGKAIVNYSGHGNVDVWTGASIFTTNNATGLTNGNKLSFVVVMDCLNGYFQDPTLLSLAEAFVKAPNGGAVAAFASSGLTTTFGQRQMELQLYTTLYGAQPIALGDAIKIAKSASSDIDVKRTWIFFGDPSLKIR
jgi:hypothetical protein